MMDYDVMPRLRLEVEGMKAAIITHLGVSGSELGSRLSTKIDEAVALYPWDNEVKRIVNQALTASIEAYFHYGEGKKLVDDAVSVGFAKSFHQEE